MNTANRRIKLWDRDNNSFLLLFLGAFISIYFLPEAVSKILFLVYLVLIYKSKRDYLWIAFLLLLIDAPGRLFIGAEIENPYRIPAYTILPGISLSFQNLFAIVYLIKYSKLKRKSRFIFNKYIQIYFIIIGFLLIYSLVLGANLSSFIISLRGFLFMSLLIIVPQFLNDYNKLLKFSKVIFPIAFFIFFARLYGMITGEYLAKTISGGYGLRGLEVVDFRLVSAAYLSLTIITLSLYFILNEKSFFKRSYLFIVFFMGFISIIITGTRGWFLALSFMIIMVLFASIKNATSKKLISYIVSGMVVLFLLNATVPVFQNTYQQASERLSTVSEVIEKGSESEVGRISTRAPALLKKIKEKPVFGFGFSDEYRQHSDAHVGQLNLILNSGIIGYLLLNIGFFMIVYYSYRNIKSANKRGFLGHGAIVLPIALLAIYVIHSTSTQLIGYSIIEEAVVLYAIILSGINIFISERKQTL